MSDGHHRAEHSSEWTETLLGRLTITGVVVIVSVLALQALAGACGERPRTRVAARPPAADPPPEVKVAVLDGHLWLGSAMADDRGRLAVNRVRYLLNELARKSGTRREVLADQAFAARRELRESFGRDASLQAILEDANEAYPEDGAGTVKSSDVMAMIVLLRGSR